jgi:hypothetical protein
VLHEIQQHPPDPAYLHYLQARLAQQPTSRAHDPHQKA